MEVGPQEDGGLRHVALDMSQKEGVLVYRSRLEVCQQECRTSVLGLDASRFPWLKTDKDSPGISGLHVGLQTMEVSVLSGPSDMNKRRDEKKRPRDPTFWRWLGRDGDAQEVLENHKGSRKRVEKNKRKRSWCSMVETWTLARTSV